MRPGESWVYHSKVPRKLADNLLCRKAVLERCSRNRKYREAVRYACVHDPLFWINTFVWQFNPNAVRGERATDVMSSLKVGPFLTWPFQDAAYLALTQAVNTRTDLLIEKSRELGASWLCLLWQIHPLLYSREMVKYLTVSRNKEAVDKPDDSDSLFWKVDYVLARLPEWIAPPISRRVMGFRNDKTDSMLTGQATTEKIGIGGRADAIFLDEFSRIPNAYAVYDGTASTSDCRIFNGTHFGTGTCFHWLAQQPHIKKLVMHWSQHPDKGRGKYRFDAKTQRVQLLDTAFEYPADFRPVVDGTPTGGPFPGLRSPWYDRQVKRKTGTRGIAADLDIDAAGSAEQLFDPLMLNDLTARYCKDAASYDLEYDRQTAQPVRLHKESGGLLKLWLRVGPEGLPPPGLYGVAADTAQGNGKATSSCLSVVNMETGEKVGEYRNPSIEPKEFAYYAAAIARLFVHYETDSAGSAARMIWETGGPGSTFGKHVQLLQMQDIYFRPASDTRVGAKASDNPGWGNSPESMMALMIDYRDALRSQRFLNRSKTALLECLYFQFGPDGYVYHSGTKDKRDNSAAAVNHGDQTIADALAWKITHEKRRLAGPNLDRVASDATFATPGLSLKDRRIMADDGRRMQETLKWD